MTLITTLPNRASPQGSALAGNALKQYELKTIPPRRELLILWTLQKNGESGVYGLDIQRAIEGCSQGAESMPNGTLYSMLKRLRKKEYIDSYEGSAPNGGAKRQYYFLTDQGLAAIECINAFFERLKNWQPE